VSATPSALPVRGVGLLLLLTIAFSPPCDAEDTTVFIRSLDFEGVEHVSESELADALLTSGPSWRPWAEPPKFDESALLEDMERIDRFYRDYGYYQTQVRYELHWNDDRSRVRIRIIVDEGPPIRLTALQIVQREPARLSRKAWGKIIEDLPLHVGEIFGVRDYREVRGELTDRLAEAGHPQPKFDGGAEVDVDAGIATVRWTIDPGPEVRFGEIRVVGLERVEEAIVLRELTFATGDRFDVSSRRKTREKLFALGLFRSIAIECVAPGDPTTGIVGDSDAPTTEPSRDPGHEPEPEVVEWPVTLRIYERLPRTVRVGVGYGTEELYRARVEWRHRNFLGEARLLDLRLQYNALTPGFEVGLTQPHFMRPGVRLRAEGAIRYETMPAYEAVRFASAIQLERDLWEHWAVRGGYGFEIADVDPEDPTASDGIDRVSGPRFGLERDTIDDRFEPRRGTWLQLSAAPSLEAFGATGSWVELSAEGRGFLPVFFATLGLRARIAGIESFADTGYSGVPVFKRLFSGGSNSVRGFKFQELGPLDVDGDPVGGRSLFEGSIELRFPIWGRLRGVGFVDVGLVDRKSFHYRLGDLRESAGPGLRFSTPVGAIRFDVGFPLDRRDGEDAYRIHLAVGNFF
jgi:outer membrane protein assembly factor BamA